MEYAPLLGGLALLIAGGVIGFFLKQYLPSYFTEKGKNLATKEDIQDITDKIERVKVQYAAEIEKLKSDLEHQNQILGRRRDVYDNLGKSLSVFITGRGETETQQNGFLEAYSLTWLWAPDSVIISLNALIKAVLVSSPTDDEVQVGRKAAYGACILEMRKDAGFPGTELKGSDFQYVSFPATK